MIEVNNISQANFDGLDFNAVGDGVADTMHLELNNPPWNLSFQGKVPVGATVDTRQNFGPNAISATAVTSIDTNQNTICDVTLSRPLALGEVIGPTVTFDYGV